MKVIIQLEQSDINSLHDTIIDAYDLKTDLTNEEVLKHYDRLPNDILVEIAHWGISDTVVRDNIYVWLKENKI